MENIINAEKVTAKIQEVLNGSETIATLSAALTAKVQRYNEVKFDGAPLTEAETEAEVTSETLLAGVDTACEKLNHATKIAVYEALFAMRQDALPAILLGAIPQYTHKETSEGEPAVTAERIIKRPVTLSIKNYDTWSMKTHNQHIVADPSYFAKADTLSYYLLENTALAIGMNGLTNYRYTYGFTEEIQRKHLVGAKASKTTICIELQRCLDALLFVPRNDNKNAYRCISKDVSYLQQVVTSAGRERLTLKAMKASQFLAKVEDVMFRVVTDSPYNISYTQAKAK